MVLMEIKDYKSAALEGDRGKDIDMILEAERMAVKADDVAFIRGLRNNQGTSTL